MNDASDCGTVSDEEIGGLAAFRFKPSDLRAIERANALRLMPKLKA